MGLAYYLPARVARVTFHKSYIKYDSGPIGKSSTFDKRTCLEWKSRYADILPNTNAPKPNYMTGFIGSQDPTTQYRPPARMCHPFLILDRALQVAKQRKRIFSDSEVTFWQYSSASGTIGLLTWRVVIACGRSGTPRPANNNFRCSPVFARGKSFKEMHSDETFSKQIWYTQTNLVYTDKSGIHRQIWYTQTNLVYTDKAGIHRQIWYTQTNLVYTDKTGIHRTNEPDDDY
jgi:hypothetical protein